MLGAGLLIYGNPTECSICSEGPDSAWIILLRAVHVWNTKLQNSIKLGCIKRRASQRNYIEKEKSQSLTYIVILCYLNTIYLLFLLNIILMRCDLQWIQVLHTNLDFFFIHVHIAHNWMPWSPNPIQILAAIYILPRYACTISPGDRHALLLPRFVMIWENSSYISCSVLPPTPSPPSLTCCPGYVVCCGMWFLLRLARSGLAHVDCLWL
jgi:hypothetical protein